MRIAIFLLFFLISPQLLAKTEYEITLKKSVKLYAEPSRNSEVLNSLTSGTLLRGTLSQKKYFLEIEVQGGTKAAGYVYTKSLKGSKIKKIKSLNKLREVDQTSKKSFLDAYAFTLRYSQVEMTQSGYSDTVSEVLYDFSEFKSSSPTFELQLSVPSQTHWNFRFAFVNRKTSFKSVSKATSINQTSVEVLREQTLYGLSINANYFFNKRGDFYVLLGAEAAKGTDVNLKFGEQELPTTDDTLPFFALLKVGLGYDINLYGPLYLNPEFRIGGDLDSNPLVTFYTLSMGLSWVL